MGKWGLAYKDRINIRLYAALTAGTPKIYRGNGYFALQRQNGEKPQSFVLRGEQRQNPIDKARQYGGIRTFWGNSLSGKTAWWA